MLVPVLATRCYANRRRILPALDRAVPNTPLGSDEIRCHGTIAGIEPAIGVPSVFANLPVPIFVVVQKCCATRVIQLVERSPVHQRPAAILQHVYAELPCLQSRGACMQRNVSERCFFLQHSTLATGTGMDPNLLSLTSSAARANFILSLQPR